MLIHTFSTSKFWLNWSKAIHSLSRFPVKHESLWWGKGATPIRCKTCGPHSLSKIWKFWILKLSWASGYGEWWWLCNSFSWGFNDTLPESAPQNGGAWEYSLEHWLSQNPGDSEAETPLGHPGPSTAGSLMKDASCWYWVGFEKQRGCYINPSRKWRQPRIWKGSGVAWQEWWFVLYVGTMPQAAVGSCYIWREARKLRWDAQHMLLSYVATSLLIRFAFLAN